MSNIGKNLAVFTAFTALFLLLGVLPSGAVSNLHEIVFIDSAVQNAQILVDGIRPGVEVVRLDAGRDGVGQMGEILADRRNVQAIHVISHGAPGRVFLGTGVLSSESVGNYDALLKKIGKSLHNEGDILFYGCNVAEGAVGKSFVNSFAKVTGAKVAASTDKTGAADRGGNAVLEYSTGAVSSTVIAGMSSYPGVLGAITYNFLTDAQGWTGALTYWHGFGYYQICSGTDIAGGAVNAYPPTPRYIQTLKAGAYLANGGDFTMNAYYLGSVVYTTTIPYTQNPYVTYTINSNVDRLEFVPLGGGNNWFYPSITDVVTQSIPPTITSATYDASTGTLTVTGTTMTTGDTIDVAMLTLTGQGGVYTLTSANTTASNATTFAVTLNATDKMNVNGLLNKNGTTAVSGTTYNIAAATNWDSTASAASDLFSNGVTVSNVQTPTITGVSYDVSTHVLSVTGTNFVKTAGATNDITVNKLTFTGQGGGTYTLTAATSNVEITNATSFSVTLAGADITGVEALLNKNGTASLGGTTYNLSAADDWDSVIGNTNIQSLTNGITVSGIPPTITSATYSATTNVLSVTAANMTTGDTIVTSKLTLKGDNDNTYTLTSSSVTASSATAFSITLNAADQLNVEGLLNKTGTASRNSATAYNLGAASGWDSTAASAPADDTNLITVSAVSAPTLTSATYDASTGVLTVTGTGLVATSGSNNDIAVGNLKLKGEGGGTYTLTSPDVDVTSLTQFSVTLTPTDKVAVNGLLNKNGTSAVDNTIYYLNALQGWDSDLATASVTIYNVTVSNVTSPTITSATYDASIGTLVVTGSGLVGTPGASNDITANKLTFTGEGGGTYTLTDTANVEITSATAFTLTLSATDKGAVNQIVNKNGTASTGASTYNLSAATGWNSVLSSADLTGNGITASNVAVPTITSATYDASSGALVVTGSGFLQKSGATNDIVANKFTFTGEGGATYTLTDTANVDISSGTSFTLSLSATDKAAINQFINKNGTSATGATTYNLAAAEDWNAGADAAMVIADLTANGITVSNVAAPTITSATYNASTGALVVTGTGFLKLNGATNDIDVSKLTITGEGGSTSTLTTTSVEITSGTSFTVILNATDLAAVNQILNKNGTASTSAATYNLAAAEDWNAGADAAVVIADLTGNGITVSNVAVPTITSATYDAVTGSLVVTGTGFLQKSGATNDIVANKFTLTGEAGATYTLTDTANVEITSGAAFTITLSATDKAAINLILNKNGTASTSATTYNLAAAEDWNAGADAAVVITDLTGNGITVSNVAVPTITSATYNASSGSLVVTGTGFLPLNGAANDIVANKFTLTGEGGATYTLTDTANVDISSGTSFTLSLSATDKAAINQFINKNGTSATGATTYNLAAAEDWNAGADTAVIVADLVGNGITVSNVAVPTITSATYDAIAGTLTVTGTGLLKFVGAANDINVSKLSISGDSTTYTLTTASVEITNGTSFTVTVSGTDKTALVTRLNKNGTSSTGAVTYNLAAAEDWAAGADAAVVVADLADNGITVSNAPPGSPTATATSSITFSDFNANWNAVTGATGYYLDVATDSGFTSFATGFTNLDVGNVTTKGVTGLTANTPYFYRVRAYNNGGASANSNTISLTTATTRTVTNNTDSAPGSLRQTITDANPGDIITFDPGLNGQTITLSSILSITKDLTISGPGAASLAISGGGTSQLFQVTGATAFTLQNLTLANGSALNGGALVDNPASTTTITGCVFSANSASGNGGAINTAGTMTISNTLFSGNSAAVEGGAIFNNDATLALANLTMNGNSAANGGGFYNFLGTATIANATIAANSATVQGGGLEIAGGTLNIKNSIVSDNTAPAGPDIFGTVTSQGYNLVRDTTNATIGGAATGNLSGQDPKLGSVANNGGPTATMALLSGSPAIDSGNCASGPATDQRGMLRAQDATCDIGAHERGVPASVTADSGTPQSTVINNAFGLPLSARVTDSLGAVLDGVSVAFAGPGSGAGIAAGSSINTNSAGIAVFGPTANAIGGTYSVTATVSALSATFNLTNNKQTQTITFANPGAQTFGTTPTLTATASSTLTPAFTSTTTGVCTITAGGALTFVTTGTCTINADQAGNGSYQAATQVSCTFTVNKANQALSFGTAPSVVVGGTGAVSATGGASTSPVTFSSTTTSVCTVSGTTVTGVTAGTCTIAANQAGDANYNAAPQVTQNITIGKGGQTLAFGAAPSIVVGGTGAVSATGGPSTSPVTFSSTTSSVCTVSGTTVTGVTAGTCTIAANQAGDANYNAATQGTQSITIGKGGQTLSFGSAPSVVVGGTGAVSATGGVSTSPVTFSSTTSSVCTISGTMVTGVTTGTCTIAANQAADGNYNAAPQVTQNITIGKGAGGITITPTSLSATYDGSPKAAAATTSPPGLTVTYTYDGSATPPTNIGSYTVVATVNDSNYQGTTSGTLIISYGSTGPSITLSTLADAAVTSVPTINISGIVTASNGLKSLTVSGTPVTVNNDGGFSTPVTLKHGSNAIAVIAIDNADLETTVSRTITLDAAAPLITPDHGQADNSVINTPQTTISGSVDSAGTTVTITVNGGEPQTAVMNGTGFSLPVELTPGLNTIIITATDASGRSASIKLSVTRSNDLALTVTTPSHDLKSGNPDLTISGTVIGTPPLTVTVAMDGQSFTPTVTNGSFSQALTLAAEKSYPITVTATDGNGSSASITRTVIYAWLGNSEGGETATLVDTLRAFRISLQYEQSTDTDQLRYDVAPLDQDGKPQGNGIIELGDVILLLRNSIGLMSW